MNPEDPTAGLFASAFYFFAGIIIVFTVSINIQGMVAGSEIVELARCPDDLLNAGITKLSDLPGFDINEMVVLHAMVGLFKLGDVLAELVLYHQVAIEQQLNGIVKGGPAYPVVLVLHENIQRFNIEMPLAAVYLIQNGIPFRSLAMPFLFQVFGEQPFYRFFRFILNHN